MLCDCRRLAAPAPREIGALLDTGTLARKSGGPWRRLVWVANEVDSAFAAPVGGRQRDQRFVMS